MDKKNYKNSKIILNQHIQDDIYLLELEGKFDGKPGQFYMLRAWDDSPILPRPLSIYDLEENKISFLYKVVGKGTTILSELKEGANIKILGPLGNGFPIENINKCAIVAGGIGIAPFMYLVKTLKCKIDLFAGFYDKSYLMEDFKKHVDNIHVTTVTGREGHKGLVTDIIKDEYDYIFACGPNAMMQSLQKRELSGNSYYSLEAHMACGIGACYGCAIETTKGVKRVCHEGPVFKGEEVVFDAGN